MQNRRIPNDLLVHLAKGMIENRLRVMVAVTRERVSAKLIS